MTHQSRYALRESWIILATWCCFCAVVIGCCARAYRAATTIDAATVPETVLGLPAWVFWGIAVPWVFAMVFTIGFALRGIANEEQDGTHE